MRGDLPVRKHRAGDAAATVVLGAPGGTQIASFTPDIWDAFGAASIEVLEGYTNADIFKKIHDSAQKSMRESSGWLSQSDSAYVTERNRVLAAK